MLLQDGKLACQQVGQQKVAQPLMVGREHKPRCVGAVAGAEYMAPLRLQRLELTVGRQVSSAEFPMFVWITNAFTQAFKLLLWGNLQIHLEQYPAISAQLVFKVGNFLPARSGLRCIDKTIA